MNDWTMHDDDPRDDLDAVELLTTTGALRPPEGTQHGRAHTP